MGVAADGSEGANYMPGMELRAKYTLFCEGARGHIGKRLIERFDLAAGRDPQHYAIGFKELWDVPAESEFEALAEDDAGGRELTAFTQAWESSWAWQELQASRSFGPAVHRYGTLGGGAYYFVDQLLGGGKLPTLHDTTPDYRLTPAAEATRIDYPKPDGKLSFDKPSSVFLSNTNHDEDQPCHLRLTDPSIPIEKNLPEYAEPAQRYCPVGVYEVVEESDGPRFQINFQNCIHCKTCDIKDPAQHITWVAPEGGGGPNYPNM